MVKNPNLKIGISVDINDALRTLSDALGLTALGTRLNASANRVSTLTEAQTSRDVKAIEEGLMEWRGKNLRAILEKTIPRLEDVETPKIDDSDWAIKWLEKASSTSDEELQTLWAKILAGELQVKGSYSKWALDAVSNMSKEDIEAFTTLGSCVWWFGPEKSGQEVVYWDSSKAIVPLQEYVLERAGFARGFGSPLLGTSLVSRKEGWIRYFSETHMMSFPESLQVDRGTAVSLTLLGKELLPLCDAIPNEKYKQDCIAQWGNHGVKHLGVIT